MSLSVDTKQGGEWIGVMRDIVLSRYHRTQKSVQYKVGHFHKFRVIIAA